MKAYHIASYWFAFYPRRPVEILGQLTILSRRYGNRPRLDQRLRVGDYLHLLVERWCIVGYRVSHPPLDVEGPRGITVIESGS